MSKADKIEEAILNIAVVGGGLWAFTALIAHCKRKADEAEHKGTEGVGGYGKVIRNIYDMLQDGYSYGNFNHWYPNGERYFKQQMYVTDDGKYIHWEHFGASANRNQISELKWIIENIFDTTPEQFVQDYFPSRWEGHKLIVYYPDGSTKVAEDFSDLYNK